MKSSSFRWMALVTFNLLALSMLGFLGTLGAAPQNRQPFSNAVQQRQQMISELSAIKLLLKEQNALLRAASANDTKERKPR